MKTSRAGRAAIARREGNVLKAYLDSVGILTIGVGHTSMAGPPKVTKGMKITGAQSDEILQRDLASVEASVSSAVKVPLNQNEFDALVSLVFNIGAGAFKGSSVLKNLNAGNRAAAARSMLAWNKGTIGGKKVALKGLTMRRQEEREQFLRPAKAAPAAPPVAQKPVKVTPLPAAPIADKPVKLEPVAAPAQASNKEIIMTVQRRLKDLGYNPGGADGLIGPLTRGSILSFKNDNKLKPVDTIDDEFLSALAVANPRKMVPERANASATEIAAKVPEANAHWWNKYLAGGGAGTGVLLALGDAIAPAKGYVDQLRDDVPAWAWFILFAVFCGGIAYMALRGQKSSDDAYRTGERR